MLKYFYEGRQGNGAAVSGSVVVRPSGTEPKLKTCISVTAPNREEAEKIETAIAVDLKKKLV